jgi:hypothetical protein
MTAEIMTVFIRTLSLSDFESQTGCFAMLLQGEPLEKMNFTREASHRKLYFEVDFEAASAITFATLEG